MHEKYRNNHHYHVELPVRRTCFVNEFIEPFATLRTSTGIQADSSGRQLRTEHARNNFLFNISLIAFISNKIILANRMTTHFHTIIIARSHTHGDSELNICLFIYTSMLFVYKNEMFLPYQLMKENSLAMKQSTSANQTTKYQAVR